MKNKRYTFKKPTTQKVLLMLFSLLCSLLIWFYVTETIGDDINLPIGSVKVVFEGENSLRESQGLIISDVDTNSVKVTVSGNRRAVSALDAADLKAVIDLSGITKTGNYSLSPKVTYPSRTDTSAITNATVNPGTVSFYVDKISKKTVDLVGLFNGSPAEGFSAEPIVFEPSTVIVFGPEKSLAKIDHAYVEINREFVDKTLSFASTFQLIDVDGKVFDSDDVTCDRETVNVTLPINAIKEVDLTVAFVSGAGATERNVRYTVEPESIILSGDSDTLDGVNSITLAKIDLGKIDETFSDTYRIVIPNDTVNMSGTREAVVTLELDGLSKQSFTIDRSNITCSNVSEGYVAEIINSSLENVIIRGPESALRNVADVNIRAVADLTEFGTTTGILAVPVKISIDGTAGVGAFGEYKVYINVTKYEEEP